MVNRCPWRAGCANRTRTAIRAADQVLASHRREPAPFSGHGYPDVAGLDWAFEVTRTLSYDPAEEKTVGRVIGPGWGVANLTGPGLERLSRRGTALPN